MIEEKLNWSDRIMKTYPNATKKLTDFCYDILKGMQKTMLEGMGSDAQIPEIPQEAAKQYCHVIMATNPRILYDFFDSKNIFLMIEPFCDENEQKLQSFGFRILYTEYKIENMDFKNRIEAETAGFEQAFKFMEEKI